MHIGEVSSEHQTTPLCSEGQQGSNSDGRSRGQKGRCTSVDLHALVNRALANILNSPIVAGCVVFIGRIFLRQGITFSVCIRLVGLRVLLDRFELSRGDFQRGFEYVPLVKSVARRLRCRAFVKPEVNQVQV